MTAINSIKHCILLRDGNKIPIFGLGVWAMDNGPEISSSVKHAIKAGYRLFDTATMYGNEEMLGKTLHESGLNREEFFVVSKLSPDNHGFESAIANVERSLKLLGLSHVDLYLIHTSRGGKLIDTWKGLIHCKNKGLVKSIGVSNFNVQHIEPLISHGLEVPAVNQIELNPWHQQPSAVSFCEEKNISLMGFCPLARTRKFEDGIFPTLDNIRKKLNKTKAQIVLRWALQRNFITIPKSSTPSRILENSQLFDWQLDEEMMSEINKLNINAPCSSSSGAMHEPFIE